jgi:hypothetical protein
MATETNKPNLGWFRQLGYKIQDLNPSFPLWRAESSTIAPFLFYVK